MERLIREAIEARAPLRLSYETTGAARRTVHPQVLFHTADGQVRLDAYQVAGPTRSGQRLPSWRQLDPAKISRVELLPGEFPPAPGLNLASPKYRSGVIAHV